MLIGSLRKGLIKSFEVFMKTRSLFSACLFVFAFALLLPFTSCSDMTEGPSSSAYVGSVSFSLSNEFIQKALYDSKILKAESNDPSAESWEVTLRLEVSLNGDYADTHTKNIKVNLLNSDGEKAKLFPDQTFNFESIPIGCNVYAKVRVFLIGENLGKDDEKGSDGIQEAVTNDEKGDYPLAFGKSNTIEIAGGQNTLTLTAYSSFATVPFEFTIEFDEAPELPVFHNQIFAFDPSSEFIKKLKAASTKTEKQEVCKDINNIHIPWW